MTIGVMKCPHCGENTASDPIASRRAFRRELAIAAMEMIVDTCENKALYYVQPEATAQHVYALVDALMAEDDKRELTAQQRSDK
jgi:hypothetical protein